MDIQTKTALLDVLKERCAVFNDGILARYRASAQSHKILALAKIRININGANVTQDGELVAHVRHRYSTRKVGGCYRQLTPTMKDIKEVTQV